LNPRTIGNITTNIPSAKTNVIKSTCFRSLKTDPKYAGRRYVMQHGAKSAIMPAIKDDMSEAPINSSMFKVILLRLRQRSIQFGEAP